MSGASEAFGGKCLTHESLAEAVEREPAHPGRATVDELRELARRVRDSGDEPLLTDDDLYDDLGLPR